MPPTSKPADSAPAPQAAASARKGKPTPKATTPAATEEPLPEPPVAPPPPVEPPAPEKPALPSVTFNDVKVLVAQGDRMRDREALLRLDGDHLSVLDRSGQKEILSLPYSSVVQAFYSRSKQPRWKGPDGKEAVASVDLGKMSFFRGERNWLILTTQDQPVFIRLEDKHLRTALPAIEERTGVKIQR